MSRATLAIATLAAMGLVAAAGIGLLVNEVSGDSIGLAAKPLSAAPLAPAQAASDRERRAGRRDRRADRRERRRERREEAAVQTPLAPPEAGDDDGLVLSGDDHGGDDSGSGNSGSGSSNSGPGSSSSGSGSDDSIEIEDD